uniref:Sperm flagellar 2 n=1 Tax=Malurus cyaneus samueli TaxID=2593467 RepID=A0A8C5TPN1_9PASS
LHKYGLQDDFEQFSKSRNADAKISNFSRLEPTFHLLGVKFHKKVAQNIMTGQHGAATNLLYELYIALEKKRKAKLTAVSKLLYFNIFITQISEPSETKYKPITEKSARVHVAEQHSAKNLQGEQRAQDTEQHYVEKRRENEVMARNQTAVIEIKKQPPRPAIKSIEAKRLLKKKREAQELLQTQKLQETTLETILETQTELLNIYSDDEYIRKIQKRLEEDKFAREQRAKRRRRMLVDQLAAHEIQEKAYREEQLIYRLMKQSQHERRIAAELMHVRHEKEVLKQNRIFREKQYEERRQKEFQEALDREAALAKQEKIDNEEQIIKEREYHERMAAERAQARYKKHYSICWEMINQIIDLSTKIGEYRQRMNNRVPFKLILDWKECFINGKPIYEQASIQPLPDEPSPEQLVELNKMSLLDERDYGEYKSMTGKWSPTEENSENKPPLNNNILGHVLRRMMEMFYPPKPKSSPEFPSFPVKGCILGKMFSGKTTCAKFIEKVCNIQVLSVGTLVQEAIEAFLNNEMKSEHDVISQETEISMEQEIEQVPFDSEEQNEVSMFLSFGLGSENKLLFRFYYYAINSLCNSGSSFPFSRIPPEKGWIVEGFPMTINQAKLFEKSYTGFDLEAKDPICEKMSLAIDPRVPKEPPPISPAFDVSILLDVSDSVVLNRAADVKYTEILEERIDIAREQVLHRISGFLKTWPKLEKWFSVHRNTLVKVNAETEESLVCETVKEIIIEEIAKHENRSNVFHKYYEKIFMRLVPAKEKKYLEKHSKQ